MAGFGGNMAALLLALGAAPALADGPLLPAGLDIPPQAADGTFRTINSGIDPAQTVWHVRSALNVAALSCHDAAHAALIAQYNSLIVKQRKSFRAADAAVRQRFQAQYPDSWQTEHDLYMTRLYNFFSQPLAQAPFCEVATAVSADAAAVPAGGFEAFAPGALARLEAPFLALYRRYDEYRLAYAAWQQRSAGATPAAAIPAPAAAAVEPPPQLGYGDLLADAAPTLAAPPPAPIAAPAAPTLGYAALGLDDDPAAPASRR